MNDDLRKELIKKLKKEDAPIYMDYQATSPLDPRVLEAMMPTLTYEFGNAHSNTHSYGWKAKELVDEARSNVAKVINADPKEIFFTSGATESNNTIIKGVGSFYGNLDKNPKRHIITVVTEHKCILESFKYMSKKQGFDVTYLCVKSNGLIDLNELKEVIRSDTLLVSIMAVNNEIGVIQPLKEIGKICKEKGVFFHTDAAQAFGKIPLDVKEMNIDLMSISGHKIYGPKGIGAMYIRRKPRIRIEPLIHGGGQERGYRSGTLPVPLVVGLGKAAEIALSEMEEENKRLKKLYDKFLNGVLELEKTSLNGDKEQRYYGNINISFAGVEGESLMMGMKEIAVSSGSACTSEELEGSYVVGSLGIPEDLIHTSIRFGIGRFTTEEEIDTAVEVVKREVTRLREMSPLWDMIKAGVDLSKVKWSEH